MKKSSLLLLVAMFLSTAILLSSCGTEAPADTEEVRFVVGKGSSAKSVAAALSRDGLVRNKAFFLALLKIRGLEDDIKAGTYRISKPASLSSLVSTLTEGKISQRRVTIPEGATLRNVAGLLEDADICGEQAFIDTGNNKDIAESLGLAGSSLEGFLYPDTYIFPEDSEAGMVAERMVSRFFAKYQELSGKALPEAQELLSQVTLASIVEREYRIASEAGLIASVFKNRISLGMPLQSCATVVYVITEKLGKEHPPVLYYSDLKIPDPYNSYLHKGLPPGPIANPGEQALKAVLDTPKSEYLYFRLQNAEIGSHRFSRSFEEHTGESIPVKGF
ncbi:MAG: endolytic transglycosylase MltG [Spirochaetia bacterium]|nr:endolytic transglycosylase MltG [Spirochaetia bacterium]